MVGFTRGFDRRNGVLMGQIAGSGVADVKHEIHTLITLYDVVFIAYSNLKIQ
jgi:hypothetical protein